MSAPAIAVENLGKRYRIGAASPRARTLKEALVSGVFAPLKNLDQLRRLRSFRAEDDPDVIWALQNVSFELQHGEILGVVGRNGAGKSTLLKVLSRITHPTTGRARVAGRLASLLEVGTGFHPELTGRDNVYLNGSILGMDRRDIRRKFDQIVEFAGVERFIDTPVKRYSSGMYLRLAFAVAAHLDPDILVVDEVLAVGDAEFQQKCLRQMDEAALGGRTVLFVSHNLGAIQRLCTRAILLDRGQLVADGEVMSVVRQYLARVDVESPPVQWLDLSGAHRSGSGAARFAAVRYSSGDDTFDSRAYPGGPLEVVVRISPARHRGKVSIAFSLRDQSGTKLINADSDVVGMPVVLGDEPTTWRFRVSRLYLKPGTYQLDLWLADSAGTVFDRLQPAARVKVVDRQSPAIGTRVDPRYDGLVVCDYVLQNVTGREDLIEPAEVSSGG